MSDPGEHGPGRRLQDRYSAKPMGAAYQASMEAVFSIVIPLSILGARHLLQSSQVLGE